MPKTRKRVHKTATKKSPPTSVSFTLDDDIDLDIDAEPEPTEADKKDAALDSDLESIYSLNDDDEAVDMTRLDQQRSVKRWVGISGIIILLLAIIAYSGYVVFRNDFQGDETVQLHISVDDQLASGDVSTIEVTYVNNKSVDLTAGQIELFAPDGFVFQSASPQADESNRVWNVHDVKPGAGGKIRITGQLVGAKDDVKEFSALFTYTPANFSTEFQESARAATRITSSIVDVQVDAPAQVSSGQEFTYIATITNTSSAALEHAKVVIEYPEGFAISSTDPEAYTNDSEWRFDRLDPNTPVTIQVVGTLEGSSADTKQFHLQFGLIEIDNSYNVQLEQNSLVLIVNPEIELSIAADTAITPGEPVNLVVTVKNTADTTLKKVVVHVDVDDNLFSTADFDFDTIDTLSPFDDTELSQQLTVRNALKQGSGDVTVSVASAVVDGANIDFPEATASTSFQAKATISASAIGRYFDKKLKKVGDGPIPPTVGQTTTYVIEWSVTNGSNTLTDFQMTTSLPDGVAWAANNTDNIVYDDTTGQVTLVLSSLDARATTTGHFSVAITPQKSDVDSLMVLTRDALITATDSLTKDTVSEDLPRITTDVPSDEGAAGKGVVVAG